MTITLREITVDNWLECARLTVSDDQKEFVAANVFSIAQSQFYPDWVPLAIYADETMVGFVLYGSEVEQGCRLWMIIRLMIDARYQGKGYGQAAMQAVIQRLHALPDCDSVLISFEPNNTVAEKLYASLGFEHTGLVFEGETVMRLTFADRQPHPLPELPGTRR